MLNDKTILNTGGTGDYPGNGNMKLKSSLSPFICRIIIIQEVM